MLLILSKAEMMRTLLCCLKLLLLKYECCKFAWLIALRETDACETDDASYNGKKGQFEECSKDSFNLILYYPSALFCLAFSLCTCPHIQQLTDVSF